MRRPKSDSPRCRSPQESISTPQYGAIHRSHPVSPRKSEKECHRRPYLPPFSPATSPRRCPTTTLSPAAHASAASPRALPPLSSPRQGRLASDPNPLCANPLRAYQAAPPCQQPRVLPPVERRLSLPTPPSAATARRPSPAPRQLPAAQPETYWVRMNLKFPQPQPQFVPATDGPKCVRHPGARTLTSRPVHDTLGLAPEHHIPRVASPSWEDPPTVPIQLVRCKHPRLVYPGQIGEDRKPVTPRADRPSSEHRRQSKGRTLGGFFRRICVAKKLNDSAEG